MFKTPTGDFKDWNKCIRFAKKKMGKATDSFGILKNKKLIETAKKCYCAMGHLH